MCRQLAAELLQLSSLAGWLADWPCGLQADTDCALPSTQAYRHEALGMLQIKRPLPASQVGCSTSLKARRRASTSVPSFSSRLTDGACGVQAPVECVPLTTQAYQQQALGFHQRQAQPQEHAAQVGRNTCLATLSIVGWLTAPVG